MLLLSQNCLQSTSSLTNNRATCDRRISEFLLLNLPPHLGVQSTFIFAPVQLFPVYSVVLAQLNRPTPRFALLPAKVPPTRCYACQRLIRDIDFLVRVATNSRRLSNDSTSEHQSWASKTQISAPWLARPGTARYTRSRFAYQNP